jgi:adenylylsulfate kinase-like enzyme
MPLLSSPQLLNIPLTQRRVTFVRIVLIRDTCFTEEARHNDILRKRALSSTMAPKAHVTLSVVPSFLECWAEV